MKSEFFKNQILYHVQRNPKDNHWWRIKVIITERRGLFKYVWEVLCIGRRSVFLFEINWPNKTAYLYTATSWRNFCISRAEASSLKTCTTTLLWRIPTSTLSATPWTTFKRQRKQIFRCIIVKNHLFSKYKLCSIFLTMKILAHDHIQCLCLYLLVKRQCQNYGEVGNMSFAKWTLKQNLAMLGISMNIFHTLIIIPDIHWFYSWQISENN